MDHSPVHPKGGTSGVAAMTLVVAAIAWSLAPAVARSASPSPLGASPAPVGSPTAGPTSAPSGSARPDATSPPGDTAPLPASIGRGPCGSPDPADRIELRGPIAGGSVDDRAGRIVYVSRSQLEGTLDDIVASGRVGTVGGDPATPKSAVACGSLDGPRQSPTDLAVALEPTNESGFTGTVVLHEADGEVTVTLVVVAPDTEGSQSEASPGPGGPEQPDAASPGPSAAPAASGGVQTAPPEALTSPVPRPSVQPGTSGAPPFSPLPQADPVGG